MPVFICKRIHRVSQGLSSAFIGHNKMKKYVTLLISDTSGVWDIVGKKDGLVAGMEMEISDSNEGISKRTLVSWLEWATHQIKQFPKN